MADGSFSASDPFYREALEAFRREIFSSLHAAMPGIIREYDAAAGTASVQPALRRRAASSIPSSSADSSSSGTVLTAPVLSGVPVFLPSAGFVPAPGDPCLLIFCDFCIDGFLDTGQPVIPPSPRMHDLSDAFALVGFCPALQNTQEGDAP